MPGCSAGPWREFQQHFRERKLELGECARPYGTPCQHEHACFSAVQACAWTPRPGPRLAEIIANLNDRIQEARLNGWLGEVEGLKTSRDAAARKLASLDRMRERQPALPPGVIGLPVIVETRR